MKAPLSWLRDYVYIDLPPEEIARRLTMAGVEVAGIERTRSWPGVIVGRVLKVNPHPNADRLRLVTVDRGPEGEVEVVCGAPNVAERQKIAYGGIGADVIDGHTGKPGKLKASKIRGVESVGMVLSRKELGIADDHEGILVLDQAAPTGKPLGDVLGDVVFDLELSPNRSDCLGVMGVARDIAALTGKTSTPPALGYAESGPDVHTLAKVTIDAPDLCPRYTAAVIRGVKVGPSPQWLQDRLRALGERPINNVVDATNYVMFELGQPLHAFDYSLVSGHHVAVRRAHAGETLTTLDNVERKLTADMLVIADPKHAIGLAGVMGGANSEISERTVDVLLESANFQPTNNRRTARGLGLASQATIRFEKGLRHGLAEVGLRRCVGLILEVAGGHAAHGVIDVWPGKGNEATEVLLTRQRISSLLGVEWADEVIEKTLGSLGFEAVLVGGTHSPSPESSPGGRGQTGTGAWRVAVPHWRTDITIPEDLCEELARVIGYDSVPTSVIAGRVPRWQPQPGLELRERVRDALVAAGMQETISYSATSEHGEGRVRLPSKLPASLHLQNPVSGDLSVMRRTLREATLSAYARNSRLQRGPVALFEIGKVFLDSGEGLPDQREMAVGVLGGPRSEPGWAADPGKLDFYDAKGAVEAVLGALGIVAVFAPGEDGTLAAGRVAVVTSVAAGSLKLGVIGEVSADVMKAFDIDSAPVALFELDVDALVKAAATAETALKQRRGGLASNYSPYSKFPGSERDMALVLDDSAPAGEVVRIISRNRLVATVTVFDVFKGKGVPTCKKSLGVHVIYQADDRTLTADEVEKAEQSILAQLKKDLGAELRVQ